jgi:hypothetical protein
MTYRRLWDGDGWQIFALQLVRLRHGPANVQSVPDKVKGDAGIECFAIDGCLYQCYAPEEVADVAKAASAMKAKAARDLKKLIVNQREMAEILQSVKAKRWVLLCPFLDDKAVVAHVRKNGEQVKNKKLTFLTDDFEALVQSQDDFVGEIAKLRQQSLGPPLQIKLPSDAQVIAGAGGTMAISLEHKLTRAFPNAQPSELIQRKSYIRAHLMRENTLAALHIDHPMLWEKSNRCLAAEERRLVTVGAGSGLPADQLNHSLQRIEQSLRSDLPDLHMSIITDISVGTLSDWLIRCPLDFRGNGSL